MFLSLLTSVSMLVATLVLPGWGLSVSAGRMDARGSGLVWYVTGDQLWTMDSNGGGQSQVASGVRGGDCSTYFVAPDGRSVGFLTNDGQLMIGRAGSSDAITVAAGGVGGVSWSPDSGSLLYGLNNDVYLHNIRGGEPEAIATGSGRFFFPTFSSDGRNIAFLEAPGGGSLNVIVVRLESGEWRTLGATGGGSPDGLCPDVVTWSPDGTRFLVDYGQPVFVYYLAGGTPTQVGGPGGNRSHFWSPSGDLIAFKEGDGSLWLVNSDGSGQRPLVAERVGGLAWNPRGSSLITYTTLGNDGLGDLWVINIGNGQKQQLTGGDTSRESDPVWTADGRAVLFERRGVGGEEEGIWRVAANGSDLRQLTSAGGSLQVR